MNEFSVSDGENFMAAVQFSALRNKMLSEALNLARHGRLAVNWRDTLAVPIPQGWARSQLQAGAEATAIEALRQMPKEPWEPGGSVDWRSALGSWYGQARQVLTDDHLHSCRSHLEQLRLTESVIGYKVAKAPAIEVLTAEVLDPERRRTQQFAEIQILFDAKRDRLTAEYLGGLAAGGLEVDWLSWYKARIDSWPPDHAITSAARALVNGPTFPMMAQQLPPYWNPPQQ